MGLPSVFEVFQLAIGPSMVYTTGALRTGQAFRELLLSSSYRYNHRILIELLGGFSKFGRSNFSDQAVIAGLGGFTIEEPGISMKHFHKKIKENGYFTFAGGIWPFNPESDLTFNDSDNDTSLPNSIRFHLLGPDGKPAFQTEYFTIGNGLIRGIGITGTMNTLLRNPLNSFLEVSRSVGGDARSLVRYVTDEECSRHRISRDQFRKRMLVTWKLMLSSSDRGIKALDSGSESPGNYTSALYKNYLSQLSTNPSTVADHTRVSLYALSVSEEILDSSPVITAPTCYGSIVPAVLRYIQEKFLISDDRMVDGLIVCGFFGSLILNLLNQSNQAADVRTEIAYSAIMASAGVAFLVGGSLKDIEKSATLSALLYGAPFEKDRRFEPKSFLSLNCMIAQTVPSLVDLARIQPDRLIPNFDDALSGLFPG